MSLGRRDGDKQQDLWIAAHKIVRPAGHPFYAALNRRLKEAGFDRFVEDLCEPYYADGVGRPSIPPGVYFRMLMVGYFEGIGSERGIAWRCSDSLARREFLGVPLSESTPDHSSMTRIRQRFPLDAYRQVFSFVHRIARQEDLLNGKMLGIDATTLEANAAMKSIVRKDTGGDWTEYVKGLMAQQDEGHGSDEDVRRFDRRRPGKKVSNREWESPSDPDARITNLPALVLRSEAPLRRVAGRQAGMKDGRTHLAYKAVHAVDMDSEVIVAAEVEPADRGDAQMLIEQVEKAEDNLFEADAKPEVKEVVADKGYHKGEVLAACAVRRVRTYIPERRAARRRRWKGKPAGCQEAVYANRRRAMSARGRRLQRRRSELLERSFAHVCETGGARRTHLRGLEPIRKRYLIHAAAHNLSVVMRKVFGHGKPRALQGLSSALLRALWPAQRLLEGSLRIICLTGAHSLGPAPIRAARLICTPQAAMMPQYTPSSTGC